jgi:uncharacterized coiled-coil protein SlyX
MGITGYIIAIIAGIASLSSLYSFFLKRKITKQEEEIDGLNDAIVDVYKELAIVKRQRDLLKENLIAVSNYVEKNKEIKKKTDTVIKVLDDKEVSNEEKDNLVKSHYNEFVSKRKLPN